MADYYDISVITGLMRLPGSQKSVLEERYEHYRELAGSNALIGVYDYPMWKVVVDVSAKREFLEFESRYSAGDITDRSYYSVPLERLRHD